MDRRAFLRSAGAGGLSLVAGCSAFGVGSPPAPTIHWQEDLSSSVRDVSADGGTVYVQTADRLHAFDADAGERRWETEAPAAVGATRGKLVYLLTVDRHVEARLRTTGERRWQVGPFADPAVAVGSDSALVYQWAPEKDVQHQIGFDRTTGEQLWSARGPLVSFASVAGDVGLLETYADPRDEASGAIYGLDLATGEARWKMQRHSGLSFEVLSDGRAAVKRTHPHGGNAILLVESGSGHVEWRYDPAVESVGYPTVAGGNVYFAHRGTVVQFDGADALGWVTHGDGTFGTPAVVGGTVVATKRTRKNDEFRRSLVGFDQSNGERRWQSATTDGSFVWLRTDGSRVYHLLKTGAERDTVVATDPSDGTIRWRFVRTSGLVADVGAEGVYVGTAHQSGAGGGTVYAFR